MTTYHCEQCGFEGCTLIACAGWDYPSVCPFKSVDITPDFQIIEDEVIGIS